MEGADIWIPRFVCMWACSLPLFIGAAPFCNPAQDNSVPISLIGWLAISPDIYWYDSERRRRVPIAEVRAAHDPT
jgi:hypothetical protein